MADGGDRHDLNSLTDDDLSLLIEGLESIKTRFLEQAMSFAYKRLSYNDSRELEGVMDEAQVAVTKAEAVKRLQDQLVKARRKQT